MLDGFSPYDRDIIGLVSRSHGINLRSLFAYIEGNYHLKDFNGMHIVYIMVLLRLADYAQIQPGRAPLQKEQIHTIKSPISAREWRVHNSVKNITRTHDDPESILIDSAPKNVGDFLRTRDWLEDFQSELDKSWAILGELYGRQHDTSLDKLKLSIRRVRSPILEGRGEFDFLPERVKFRVAESEMLLLLLAPLYGNHPGYGVRELLQNAHDAVQEAIYLKVHHLSSAKPAISITINLDSDPSYFEINDNGLVMSADVITKYFLNAGASYRASSEWRQNFLDTSGKSQIVRAGRFGVGALAAFLIGDKISVSTRHYLSPEKEGLTFEASLDEPEIEIRRSSQEIGTRVKISLSTRARVLLDEWCTYVDSVFMFDDVIEVTIDITREKKTRRIILGSHSKTPVYKFSTKLYNEIRVFIVAKS